MQIRSTQQYANLFSFVVIERIMSKQANQVLEENKVSYNL